MEFYWREEGGTKMRLAVYIVAIVALILVSAALYVRLAPTDMARWHQPIAADEDTDLSGGAIRVVNAEAGALEQADQAIRALPRTEVLAGSVEAGRITYVTRSALWRFPDYTTIEYSDGMLKLFGRARFGYSDLGVNAARLAQVLSALEG